jgi:hypothetical protein
MITFEVVPRFHPLALLLSLATMFDGSSWDTNGRSVVAVTAAGERFVVSKHFWPPRADAAATRYRQELRQSSPSSFAAAHGLDALAMALRSEPSE